MRSAWSSWVCLGSSAPSPEEQRRLYEEETARLEADAAANKPRQSKALNRALTAIPILFVAGIVVWAIVHLASVPLGEKSFANERSLPQVGDSRDAYGPIVEQFGEPDSQLSTEYDKPRPPISSRIMRYKKERVNVAFVPLGRVGEPPPYDGWMLLGYADRDTNQPITREEAESRLASREKRNALPEIE